ncbi:alpha-hydroxy-acid oxidizing protein [Sphingomonas formosensis]
MVRMLALGTDAVLLGRAYVLALASVARLLELIASEMRVAMTLTGVRSITGIDGTLLAG